MGTLIYKLLFTLTKLLIYFSKKIPHTVTTRNSLNLPYFRFLKSDLDISIKIPQTSDLTSNCELLAKLYTKNPLIKEINFYFSLYEQVQLQNYYEYLRDSSLKTIPKNKSHFEKEEKFVFLLRMYLSNFKNKPLFTSRTKEKFNYYFSLCGLSSDYNTEDELLEAIIQTLNFENQQNVINEIHFLIKELKLNQCFENIFINSNDQVLLASLFPNYFYFLNPNLESASDQIKIISLHQIGWELWGLSTQVDQFHQSIDKIKQFKNIQYILSNLYLENDHFQKIRNNYIIYSQIILEKISLNFDTDQKPYRGNHQK
jgi:hypothetical protein